MLEAKHPYDNGKPLIPAGTEAHLLFLYKNNYNRWQATLDYYKIKQQFGAHLPPKKPKVNGVKQPDPIHDALWTREDGGRATYGSVLAEGLNYYEDTRKLIKEARKKRGKKMVRMEKRWLEKYQEQLEKEKPEKKRGREAGDGDGEDVKRIKVFESDDELGGSDDEEEEQEEEGDDATGSATEGTKVSDDGHDSDETVMEVGQTETI